MEWKDKRNRLGTIFTKFEYIWSKYWDLVQLLDGGTLPVQTSFALI
jgi:hypothetical protein